MPKTLNRILQEDQNFKFIHLIDSKSFPELLAQLAVEYAQGWYSDIRIVPGEIALAGSEWQLKEPAHLVYAKIGQKNPAYAKRDEPHVTLCCPTFVHVETKEEHYHLPVHSV